MRIVVIVVAQTRDYENACFTIDHFAADGASELVENIMAAVKTAESSDESCDEVAFAKNAIEDSQSCRKRAHDGKDSDTAKKLK